MLQAVLAQQNVNPIVYKTAEAALFNDIADAASSTTAQSSPLPIDNSALLPINDTGADLLVAYTDNSSSVAMAFTSPSTELSQAILSSGNMTVIDFLDADFGDVQVSAPALQPLTQLFNGQGRNETLEQLWDKAESIKTSQPGLSCDPALLQLVSRLSRGDYPQRVLCTGVGTGGSLAALAALWAAVTYPAAQVRLITVGAPPVGDTNFAFALSQFVDLTYQWDNNSNSTSFLNYTGADLNTYVQLLTSQFGMTAPQTLAGQNSTSGQPTLVNGSSTCMNPSAEGSPSPRPSPSPSPSPPPAQPGVLGAIANVATSVGSSISNAVGSAVNVVSSTYDQLECKVAGFVQGAQDDLSTAKAAVFKGNAGMAEKESCMLWCRDAVAGGGPQLNITTVDIFPPLASCPLLNCKLSGASSAACNVYQNTNGSIGPDSITVTSPDYDANVAVRWIPENSTALFSVRGTVTTQDWIQDFKQALTDAPLASALENLYPGAAVHMGFLQQAQSVTDKAQSDVYNIRSVLDQMSGNSTPTLVVVTGHSLGAAVATLLAPWAALQWPSADAFAQLVGVERRMVHENDIVPSVPTFTGYVHTNYSIWLHSNQTCAYYESGAFFAPAYSTEFGGALPDSGAPYDPNGYEIS
eukprot:jgi/Astpho2/662/Aster-x0030